MEQTSQAAAALLDKQAKSNKAALWNESVLWNKGALWNKPAKSRPLRPSTNQPKLFEVVPRVLVALLTCAVAEVSPPYQ